MGHHGFVAGLGRVVGVAEEVVAGEGDFAAVDLAVQAEGKFGLAGHPVDGEAVAFPRERLAGLQGAVDLHAVEPRP